VELTQHGLCEDGHKAHGFHEPVNGQHEICDGSSNCPNDEHHVQIRLKVCPVPKVFEVQIWNLQEMSLINVYH